jgi:hypothetical protein
MKGGLLLGVQLRRRSAKFKLREDLGDVTTDEERVSQSQRSGLVTGDSRIRGTKQDVDAGFCALYIVLEQLQPSLHFPPRVRFDKRYAYIP